MATYSDKYLFEFEARSGTATANQLQRIATNAQAAAKAIAELALAFSALNVVMGKATLNQGLGNLKKIQIATAEGGGSVNAQMDSGIGGGRSAGTSTATTPGAASTRSNYLRDPMQRIGDYTKFWLIGYGINQVVQTASQAVEAWASSQKLLSDIVADFEISLKTTGDEAGRYAEKVLEISRATGISISEIGPGLVIQERVKNAPTDLTLRAAQVQRVTGADNYSVERDLLSLSKQFPDETTVTILDAFTGAMRRSSLTAAEFFDLLESSGPLARQFNTSMETVFGVFAGLSTATGESGQSIELFMRQMERVYTDVGTRSAVEKYVGPVSVTNPATGYEVRRPWDEIMNEISKLSKQAQDEIAGTIPNMLGQQTRQIFLAMMKDWQGGITDAIAGAKSATGEFERSVTIMSDTWSAKTQSMSTAWESFLTTIRGSGAVLDIVTKTTDALNVATAKSYADPRAEKYIMARTDMVTGDLNENQYSFDDPKYAETLARRQEFEKKFPDPTELFRRETGMKARPYGILGSTVPEYYDWVNQNLPKYTKQVQGETGPDAWTDWQKKGIEIERQRGQIDKSTYQYQTGKDFAPSSWGGIVGGYPMLGGFPFKPGYSGPTKFGAGMATTYLDEQKLTVPDKVDVAAIKAEIAKIKADIVAGYRKNVPGYADATKVSDDAILKVAGGLDTKSSLLLQDKSGAPLEPLIENATTAAQAIKNLGDAANDKATTLKSGFTSSQWYGGKGAAVEKEYQRLVGSEIASARKSRSDVAGKSDAEVAALIGISQDYIEVTSDVGSTLLTTTRDAEFFAAAVANVGKAMASLSYFDQPDWMGEGDYVRRLGQYSQTNLDIQTREGMVSESPTWNKYVGPSGKSYDIWGNPESLAQAGKGVSRDDKQYNEGLAATNKSNALLEKIHTALLSMVGELLQPTTVTPGDMAATGMGKYKDKWDEPVRRIQDVMDRRAGDNPNLGPWKGFAESMGIDLSSKESTAYSGEEFKNKFYNGLMPPSFYEQYSKGAFIDSAKQKIAEKEGQGALQTQAMGWLKEAGISDDMAKLVSREMSGGVSPMESYWRGGKTDEALANDMKALGGATVDKGITPGVAAALKDAKPVDTFVDSWGLNKKENTDTLFNLGKSIGGVMGDGVSTAIADGILTKVEDKIVAEIKAKLGL